MSDVMHDRWREPHLFTDPAVESKTVFGTRVPPALGRNRPGNRTSRRIHATKGARWWMESNLDSKK
jgi:hypothetical protein